MGGKPGDEGFDEDGMGVTMEELEDFLEADRLPIRANPEFRERLRRRLWDLIQGRVLRAGRDEDG